MNKGKVIQKPKKNIRYVKKLQNFINKVKFYSKVSIVLTLFALYFFGIFKEVHEFATEKLYSITKSYGFKLENVVIKGNKRLEVKHIINSINARYGIPILSINLSKVRETLLKNEWVKVGVVERKLPNTLIISIIEREPIAIWQNEYKHYLISDDGKIMNLEPNVKGNFITVLGSNAVVQVPNLIKQLSSYKELQKEIIFAIRQGQRRWDLILKAEATKDQITVKMPEEGFKEALSFLNKLYSENKIFNQSYKSIDLRDNKKVYFEK